MGSRASAIDGTARAATVLPVGKVSELLGIPAVTLRTWEARYGLGPSGRTSGSHRRYTSADIKRLRRVQQLIARGVSAGDAARLSLGGDATTGHPAHHTQRLRADLVACRHEQQPRPAAPGLHPAPAVGERMADRRQAGKHFQQIGFLRRPAAEVLVNRVGDLAAMLADQVVERAQPPGAFRPCRHGLARMRLAHAPELKLQIERFGSHRG